MKKSVLIVSYLLLMLGFAQAELISQTIAGGYWKGNVRLNRSEIKARVHNTFIEVEEEAELAPLSKYAGQNPPVDQQFNLQIDGTFTLPKGAVLTGALLWEDGKMLKAQLKGNLDVDNQFDSLKNQNSRGDFGLKGDETSSMRLSLYKRGSESSTVDTFSLSIGQVRWKDHRRVKLHYIIPVRYYETIPQMIIPRTFGESCSDKPAEYTLNLLPSTNITDVKLYRHGKTISYTLPTLIKDNFTDSAFAIRKIGEDKNGIMTVSTFPTEAPNSLTGEFMHLWSQIPDSLFLAAGLKREVVFLWRWENENSLVNWKVEQEKFLTLYGKTAIRQAANIRDAAIRLMYSKAGVAMYVDRSKDEEGNEKDTCFNMAYKNSYEATSLIDYLNYIIEDDGINLLAEIDGYKVEDEDDGDTLTADELDSICGEGFEEFQIAIDTILTLFSKDENLIKHVMIVSAGKRKTDKNLIKKAVNFEGFEEITISGLGLDQKFPNGYWPGVDLDKITAEHKLLNGENYNGFNLPRSKAATFTLEIKNQNGSVTKNILGEKEKDKTVFYDNVYFAGHTSSNWIDTLIWSAQDDQGSVLASFYQVPVTERLTADTAVAMLWGGASARHSDVLGGDSVGYVLGFVDEYYGLLAHSGDSLTDAEQKLIESGEDIPYIQIDEKHKKNTNTLFNNNIQRTVGLAQIRTINNLTYFDIYIGDHQSASLKIYDLQGRLIKTFNKEMLQGTRGLQWDGSVADGAVVASGIYVAVATIGNKVQSLRFIR